MLPLAEEKLENTITSPPQHSFTYCLIDGIRHLCPDDLGDLFERLGQLRQKRRHIVTKRARMDKFKDYTTSN